MTDLPFGRGGSTLQNLIARGLRETKLSAIRVIEEDEILEHRPAPVAQTGEVVLFKRRKPAGSEIPDNLTLSQLYDFIRMLDAEGYPLAFLTRGGVRYEFSRATLHDDHIVADVKIFPIEGMAR